MPHHKAAEKHLRTSMKRRSRNMAQKSMVRTAVKKVVQAEDKDSAEKALVSAASLIDKLARKGVIHRKTAARQKSKLTKKVNAIKA